MMTIYMLIGAIFMMMVLLTIEHEEQVATIYWTACGQPHPIDPQWICPLCTLIPCEVST